MQYYFKVQHVRQLKMYKTHIVTLDQNTLHPTTQIMGLLSIFCFIPEHRLFQLCISVLRPIVFWKPLYSIVIRQKSIDRSVANVMQVNQPEFSLSSDQNLL